MLRDEMMMYDIILNYAKRRPIYFAQTLEAEKFLGLNNYLSLEGLAYRLTNKSKDPLIVDGSVNTSKLFENLTKVFTWQGNQQSQMLDFRFRNNYAVEFGWLAYALMQEKKNVKAKEVLDAYFSAFPNTCSPFDNSVIYLMECYYSLGEIDKANDIGKCILINMQQKRIHKASLFDTTSESSLNSKTTSEIIEMADKYNQRLYYKPFIKE
jgi:hypothetical protein